MTREFTLDRVAVLGFPGSGKTTLAAQLSKEHDIPHLELDICREGRQIPAELKDFIVEGASWSLDGIRRYDGLEEIIANRAQLVIWLNIPKPLALYRRIIRDTRKIRQVASQGNELVGFNFTTDNILDAVRSFASAVQTRKPPLVDYFIAAQETTLLQVDDPSWQLTDILQAFVDREAFHNR